MELRRLGEKPVGRKTFGRIIFLGDRRLGDKLGRYRDSKLDGWATCVKEEKIKTSDTIIRRCVPVRD